jgi:hypothetical protein
MSDYINGAAPQQQPEALQMDQVHRPDFWLLSNSSPDIMWRTLFMGLDLRRIITFQKGAGYAAPKVDGAALCQIISL